jgi:uncharacterized membrane protein YbhN (UPF0104 family)
MIGEGALQRWSRWLLPIAILGLSAWVLQREAATLDRDLLLRAFGAIPVASVLAAFACTAVSFAGLAWIEAWAVRKHAARAVAPGAAALAGSACHALGHVVGWHAVLGPLLRRRAYAPHAVANRQVVAIVLSVGTAIALGTIALWLLAAAMLHSAGLAMAAAIAMSVLAIVAARRETPPSDARGGFGARVVGHVRDVAMILPVAVLEAAACVGALWVLLPSGTFASWPLFVVTCLLAQAAGVASHAPGGIGVFEAGMLASVAPEARPGLLAAILVYRGIYGIVPFLLLGVPWLLRHGFVRHAAAASD